MTCKMTEYYNIYCSCVVVEMLHVISELPQPFRFMSLFGFEFIYMSCVIKKGKT